MKNNSNYFLTPEMWNIMDKVGFEEFLSTEITATGKQNIAMAMANKNLGFRNGFKDGFIISVVTGALLIAGGLKLRELYIEHKNKKEQESK